MEYEFLFKVASGKLAPKAPAIIETMVKGWQEGKTSTAIEKLLKSQGLSYRRQNFLEDWRRAGAISRVAPGNVEGARKALEYFDKVIEPYRKQEGISFEAALKNIHKWEKNREKLVEAGDKIVNQAIQYGFDTTP